MSVLLLGQAAQDIADQVIAYAEAHRITLKEMHHIAKTKEPAGNNPKRCCIIPVNYRCAFTIEEHPSGWCRHLSVSIGKPGKVASPEALSELMKLFGFYGGMKSIDASWLEDIGGPIKAVNIVQRYTIDATPKQFLK